MRPSHYVLVIFSLLVAREALPDDQLGSVDAEERATVEPGLDTKRFQEITLEDVVNLALRQNSRLKAQEHRIAADEAMLQGDEAYPNPELAVEVEDFLGSGVAKGVDAIQVTTSLSQEIQLGGKPGARRKAKATRKDISTLEYAVERQQLIVDVAFAFLEVLAQQRRLVNSREMVRLAELTVTAFEDQVDAGRATPMEVDKAAIVLSLASLKTEQVERELLAGQQRLAAICGREEIFFAAAKGSLATIRQLPSYAALEKRVDSNPALMTKAAEIRHQRAVFELERANRVPDISISLGYRYLNETQDSAVVAGVAVPLPLANRNQGPIGAASWLEQKSKKEWDFEKVELVRALMEAFHLLAGQRRRATVLRDDVFPRVEATFAAVTEGYRIGRFGYLDLLDAQRTLFEIKEQSLEALIAYQRAAIQLAGIVALPVSFETFAEKSVGKGAAKP